MKTNTQTIFDTVTEVKEPMPEAKIIVDLISKKDEILNNPKVIETLDKGLGYTVRAKNLLKSFPTLASIEDVPIYRAVRAKNGLSVVLMPSIFNTEDGLKVCLPDVNASVTDTLKIDAIHLSLEDESYCILTDGKCFVKCSLSIDKTALKRYVIADNLTLGDYTLETLPEDLITVFRDRPKLEQTLDNLDLEKAYEIIAHSGTSKKFETPLISVKDENNGEVLENVITNANLAKNGSVGRSFKITRKETYTKTIKDGNKTKQEKQSKYFIAWLDEKPLILDLDD